jgi:hypothetical protein
MSKHIRRGVVSSEVLDEETQQANADLEFAKAFGFTAEGFEDLPGDQAKQGVNLNKLDGLLNAKPLDPEPNMLPVYKPPQQTQTTAPKTEKPKPALTAEEAEERLRLRELRAVKSTGPTLTNMREQLTAPRFIVNRVGQAAQHHDIDDVNFKGERIDNICGSLPYRNNPAFKNGVFLREPTVVDIAALSTALASRSTSALFDVLGTFVNVPYRQLTNADHIQILYYMLIKFYPAQRVPVTWDSRLYGVTTQTQAHEFYVTEQFFGMDAETWARYETQGFTLPRVYDVEAVEAAEGMKNGMALLELAQWFDPAHPKIAPYVNKAIENNSAHPRLQGRIDFLADQPARFKAEIDEFKAACGEYGVTEKIKVTAKVEGCTIGKALEYLYGFDSLKPHQEAEFTRLTKLTELTPEEEEIERKYLLLSDLEDRTPEQEEEFKALEAQQPKPYDRAFEPVEEEVSLARSLWLFFPLV